MSAEKKKIPDSFHYNNVEFDRKVATKKSDYMDKERKKYKDDGYYTKVKVYDGLPVLFVSRKHRSVYKKEGTIRKKTPGKKREPAKKRAPGKKRAPKDPIKTMERAIRKDKAELKILTVRYLDISKKDQKSKEAYEIFDKIEVLKFGIKSEKRILTYKKKEEEIRRAFKTKMRKQRIETKKVESEASKWRDEQRRKKRAEERAKTRSKVKQEALQRGLKKSK
jgi:hypothetical protein